MGGANNYHHIGADGAKGALAFTDRGQSVRVNDWKKPEVIREAMAVASEKWGSITLTGTAAYKDSALRVAAEHGYEVTNPELQARLAQERARVTRERGQPQSAGQAAAVQQGVGSLRTPAERAVRLKEIRERVGQEARPETQEARDHKRPDASPSLNQSAERDSHLGPSRR